MAKFNEYPVKTTPKDADKFMLYSAEDAANKLIIRKKLGLKYLLSDNKIKYRMNYEMEVHKCQ